MAKSKAGTPTADTTKLDKGYIVDTSAGQTAPGKPANGNYAVSSYRVYANFYSSRADNLRETLFTITFVGDPAPHGLIFWQDRRGEDIEVITGLLDKAFQNKWDVKYDYDLDQLSINDDPSVAYNAYPNKT